MLDRSDPGQFSIDWATGTDDLPDYFPSIIIPSDIATFDTVTFTTPILNDLYWRTPLTAVDTS